LPAANPPDQKRRKIAGAAFISSGEVSGIPRADAAGVVAGALTRREFHRRPE
jgi:hypothetical protein